MIGIRDIDNRNEPLLKKEGEASLNNNRVKKIKRPLRKDEEFLDYKYVE